MQSKTIERVLVNLLRSTMIRNRRLLAAMLVMAIGSGIVILPENNSNSVLATLPSDSEMPSLAGATGWPNSPPLTTVGLRGKVVLVQFWTYSCVNWLRTNPYVGAWAEKYKNQG